MGLNSKQRVVLKKPPIFRVVLLQFVVTAIASGSVAVIDWSSGTNALKSAALSTALGGLIATLGNAYFGWRAFRYNGTRFANRLVNGFYKAEIGKFAIMAVLLALVFKFVSPLHKTALMVAFIVTVLIGTIAAALLLQPSGHNTEFRS